VGIREPALTIPVEIVKKAAKDWDKRLTTASTEARTRRQFQGCSTYQQFVSYKRSARYIHLGTQHWKLFYLCMRDPIKEPKYWRDRAEATRAKAKRCYDVRQIRRMLRVAEEYDKLADRAAEWRGNSQPNADH
jgi:hypothetical protein